MPKKNGGLPLPDISSIKVIIGLGNPEPRFDLTRHNIGFLFVDQLADRYSGSPFSSQKNMLTTKITLPEFGHTLTLVKPQTYMNTSGQVLPFFQKNGIKPEEILVVHDEMEKKFGSAVIRLGGSARGHNGLKSIINTIGFNFWRLRLGIGRPEGRGDVSSYVLGRFSPNELDNLSQMCDAAYDLLGI